MFQEIMDLKDKILDLENKRVRLTKEKLMEFASEGKVDFDEIGRTMNSEKEALELLRLKLQEERERLTTSKDALESKLMEEKAYKTAEGYLEMAHDNMRRHNELLGNFADKMMQGLEIAEGNLSELRLKNLDFAQDPNPFFEEAKKYLAEGAACLNSAYEAIEAMFKNIEKSYADTLTRALFE